MCMLFEICEKTPFQKCMGGVGGVGGHSFAHRAVNGRTHRAQAMLQGSPIIPNPIRCHRCLFPQGPHISGDLHVSHFAPNRRQCRLPEIHVVKLFWDESFYPKTGLQKWWTQQWIRSGVLSAHMQGAANHLCEAFLPGSGPPCD